ncbi:hypothetical protein GIB67_017599 [Kingdonia uniflora]|uniref:Fungal lipase-type domain-containing protein n=1 Tax=Kingdonia uniflora TaxID=39325 RepID=A0A7J7LMU5_9MAGN|nr:hypothetical protein GIB67_017599 [Kingdonia uniflora]
MKALGLQKGEGWLKEMKQEDHSHSVAYYTIRDKLKDMLRKNERAKFMLTWHNLEGALAIIFPLVLALHEEEWMLKRLEGVYTFWQPRVEDEKLVEYMKEKLSSNGVSLLPILSMLAFAILRLCGPPEYNLSRLTCNLLANLNEPIVDIKCVAI